MSLPRKWRWTIFFTGAAACSAGNGLGGSVGEVFSLETSGTEIRRNAESIQVSYFRNRGASIDLVARVGVSLVGYQGKAGERIKLEGEYAPGHPRASVSHAPAGEPIRILPKVQKGDFYISSGGETDKAISGDFSMLFETEGGDLGQGRTLTGNFSGIALDGGFGILP